MKKLLLILLSVTLFSCVTTIGNLKKDPAKYVGQLVTVKGEVTKLIKIPFTDYSFFEIKDKTDNIIVFTLAEHNKGDYITIKSKVVGFDSSDEKKSTMLIIENIEEFLIKNIKLDEAKLKKTAKNIGETLSKVLNGMDATYFLLEQSK